MAPEKDNPIESRWRVMRLDDNGNTWLVIEVTSRDEAEAIAAAYEAKGHKQTYWAEPA